MRSISGLVLVSVAIVLGCANAPAAERTAAGSIEVANAPPVQAASPIEPMAVGSDAKPAVLIDRVDGGVTIVLGGDIGLGGSNQPVLSSGTFKHGRMHNWSELTAGIAPLFDGDINFANLESVVTDRNDLSARPKAFNFKSHPAGVRHLTGLGLNAVSTANNHAGDYGALGVRETVRHLEALAGHGLKAWPGIGLDREQASRPADVAIKGARVRISAIGIGAGSVPVQAGGTRPRAGMLNYNRPEDFRETVARLADAEGDLRILSVHYGSELQVRASASDIGKLRDEAVKRAGIDIVVGHHAHVAAGVQSVDGKLVLYGLGNLLHPGMQDMAGFGICRDYGLVVRVHATRADNGRLALRAVEAIPVTEMHGRAKPLQGDAARLRIEVLNYLAAELDGPEAGTAGARFRPKYDGTGLYCLPGADSEPGRIGELCRGWEPPSAPLREVGQRIAKSCGGSAIARHRSPNLAGQSVAAKRARVSPKPKPDGGFSLLSSIFGF